MPCRAVPCRADHSVLLRRHVVTTMSGVVDVSREASIPSSRDDCYRRPPPCAVPAFPLLERVDPPGRPPPVGLLRVDPLPAIPRLPLESTDA